MNCGYIFANLFPELFDYDEKYDELSFKDGVTPNILEYDMHKRNIWYKYYQTVLETYQKTYNLSNLKHIYDEEKLMEDIERDTLLPYIPNNLISIQRLNNEFRGRVFHKLFEDDYKFQQLTLPSDRKHFKFNCCVNYEDGLNLNTYLNKGLIDVFQVKNFLLRLDVRHSITYLSQGGRPDDCGELFYVRTSDKNKVIFLYEGDLTKKLSAKQMTGLCDYIIRRANARKITSMGLLQHCEDTYYTQFDLDNEEIAKYAYEHVSTTQFSKLLDHHCCNHKLFEWMREYIPKMNPTFVVTVALENPTFAEALMKQFPNKLIEYITRMIAQKQITKNNLVEFLQKYNIDTHLERFAALAFTWIKTYREEPPLEIYVSPNTNIDFENNYNTTASVWRRYVNASTVPKEMVSLNYWQYMINTKGQKKNPNHTIMYTFFSNSLENKIIFCKSDIELLPPAVPRYSIPIDFIKVKPFLHEELITNDICLFCQMTKDDWNKVAGGNNSLDIVAFSDSKNIYRERTPLRDILKYIVNALMVKFACDIQSMEQSKDDKKQQMTEHSNKDTHDIIDFESESSEEIISDSN